MLAPRFAVADVLTAAHAAQPSVGALQELRVLHVLRLDNEALNYIALHVHASTQKRLPTAPPTIRLYPAPAKNGSRQSRHIRLGHATLAYVTC